MAMSIANLEWRLDDQCLTKSTAANIIAGIVRVELCLFLLYLMTICWPGFNESRHLKIQSPNAAYKMSYIIC